MYCVSNVYVSQMRFQQSLGGKLLVNKGDAAFGSRLLHLPIKYTLLVTDILVPYIHTFSDRFVLTDSIQCDDDKCIKHKI